MEERLIPPHGGYRTLKSFQTTTIVYDLTTDFCARFVKEYRMRDQMVQAARSGRQNIAEGCQASGTSKKMEIKLVGVARASLEELLLDFEDYLRQNSLALWSKESEEAHRVREFAWLEHRSYETYKTYCQNPESAANTALCLIHQANYLLDRQLKSLEEQFLQDGGFTERLYKKRQEARGRDWDK
ncbi:MAG: four helix bundle suffix domain-containing protein [Patescibacteria group bacterium]